MEVQARPRDETSENFPVVSWLLPAKCRAHVLAFYRFARAADDIADAPTMAQADKIAALDRILGVLDGALLQNDAERAAGQLMDSLAATGLSDQHARHVLQAFRRDAENPRCRTWSDLMLYCQYSAAPVGRFLIDLHGEDKVAYPASDALCAALQILNHLQDCGDDFVQMDRVYLPTDWIAREGGSLDDLGSSSLNPPLRQVIDQCLDRVDGLLAQARPLPGQLSRTRLRYDAAVIVEIARRLARRLRRGDPLARRIELSKGERFVCLIRGLVVGWRGR